MDLLTQSAAGCFQSCRKKAELRYERGLVPVWEEDRALGLGTIVHDGLEAHHGGKPWTCADPVATAMLAGYRNAYPTESFTVVDLEREWRLPLLGPGGSPHDEVELAGKWDGVVRNPDGTLSILEHKTAAKVDGGYLAKLWGDFQNNLYAGAAERVYGEPVRSVIYNVLEKPPRDMQQPHAGETDAEWEAKLAAAKAPGRCKRKLPEPEAEWLARLDAWCMDPAHYHRESILLDRVDLDRVAHEAWQIAEDWQYARQTNRWYRNPSACFSWNKPCPYLAICQSRENPLVIQNQYTLRPAHSELPQTTTAAATTPAGLPF